ncbi:SDR family oxidoreductase [Burkholderia sp. AU31624]|nr:SDR family oxidoreductase [Burkholderia sp. AU31624]MCA8251830.1 SDR family oxidoreductase [Burkholderia sp. AU31624]
MLGEPRDIAEPVTWLCSPAARFVTGQALAGDGEFTVC